MSAYFVTLLVFGIVPTYLWLIHRFWLRDVFREDHKPAVRTRIVILGGGFGGLYSAQQFEKPIAADPTPESVRPMRKRCPDDSNAIHRNDRLSHSRKSQEHTIILSKTR